MSKPNTESKNKFVYIAFGVLPVIWAALMVAPFISGGLPGIISGFTESMKDPLKLQWCSDSLKTILIFLVIYAVGLGVYFSTKHNYRKGEEHGSAKWGSVSALSKK